jgi:hypothetical protein
VWSFVLWHILGATMSLLSKLRSGFASQRTARQSGAIEHRDKDSLKTPGRSFEAVAIRANDRACKEARQLANNRMLTAEAPRLPLASCNVRCSCTYKSYPDRRDEPRRRADVGISGSFYVGAERRRGRDRRIGNPEGGGRSYYGYMRENGTRSS